MLKFVQKKLKEEKGLTLIELLAVIVILAIVAAIAIPAIGNVMDNSRTGAIKSDAINIMSAADLYFAEVPDEDGVVDISELASNGYLDDAGSFTDDTSTAVTLTTNGANKISGTGEKGNVSLTFEAATRNDINSLKNNLSNVKGQTDGITTISKN